MLTERLELRPPEERDRDRFVELFCNEAFMVFSDGVLDGPAAHRRFDEMLQRAQELPFAKQPIIELQTDTILGYAGVNWFDFEGERRLEFGWRLVPEARGRGFATEGARAVLSLARGSVKGEILAMIDPTNHASANVACKLGFVFWKQAVIDGWLDDLYRIHID
jgi:RimJ/RimL family protein N-acetyltransferase